METETRRDAFGESADWQPHTGKLNLDGKFQHRAVPITLRKPGEPIKPPLDKTIAHPKYSVYAEHQPGILTPAQQYMRTVACDFIGDDPTELRALLDTWTGIANRLMSETNTEHAASGGDDGRGGSGSGSGDWNGNGRGNENENESGSGVTLTFGFGVTLFAGTDGRDRFGLKNRLPRALADGIPPMPFDEFPTDGTESGGDLLIQACAEDPSSCARAIAELLQASGNRVRTKWEQDGYGRTSSTSSAQFTARNFFGFKDGTANLHAEDSPEELGEHLWIGAHDNGGDTFAGGTYYCYRKIEMDMTAWDELTLREQEGIIGRDKSEGAPLSGGKEHSPADFHAVGSDGQALICAQSHMAITHPVHNAGKKMLRRGYNYMDRFGEERTPGESVKFGERLRGEQLCEKQPHREGLRGEQLCEKQPHREGLRGGLYFVAFVRNPALNFTPILAHMANDMLTPYLRHRSSGIFLIPPGVTDSGKHIGHTLFE